MWGQLPKIRFSPVTGHKTGLCRCNTCNGIWFDTEALEQYLDQVSSGTDPALRDPNIAIDFCNGCGSIWLDAT